MTNIKKTGIIIGVVLIALLILSFFLPKSISRTVSKEISYSSLHVHTLWSHFSSYPFWYYKMADDPHARSNNGLSIDRFMNYQSSSYGTGKISNPSQIADTITFADLHDNTTTTYRLWTSQKDSTSCVLHLQGDKNTGFIKNIFNLIYGYILKSQLEKQTILIQNELQKRIENKIYYNYPISQVSSNLRYFIYIKSTVDRSQKSQFYSQNITALYKSAQDAGILGTNNPCILYFNDPNAQNIDMAPALETVSESFVKSSETIVFPRSMVAKIVYKGARDRMKNVHHALSEFMIDQRIKPSLPIIEEYVTSPIQEPDQSKWETNVYYYLTPQINTKITKFVE